MTTGRAKNCKLISPLAHKADAVTHSGEDKRRILQSSRNRLSGGVRLWLLCRNLRACGASGTRASGGRIYKRYHFADSGAILAEWPFRVPDGLPRHAEHLRDLWR
jgi:hypothetical protein